MNQPYFTCYNSNTWFVLSKVTENNSSNILHYFQKGGKKPKIPFARMVTLEIVNTCGFCGWRKRPLISDAKVEEEMKNLFQALIRMVLKLQECKLARKDRERGSEKGKGSQWVQRYWASPIKSQPGQSPLTNRALLSNPEQLGLEATDLQHLLPASLSQTKCGVLDPFKSVFGWLFRGGARGCAKFDSAF